MVIKINLLLVTIAISMLGVMLSVYAHTPYCMKGYKLGMEDVKTRGGGYGLLLPFIFVLFYKLVAKGVCATHNGVLYPTPFCRSSCACMYLPFALAA